MTIRSYIKEDKAAVMELLKVNTPKYFDHTEEIDLSEYLDNEVEDYFVAENNDEIIGAGGINYFLEEKIARISWDMIKPNLQGKGIGRKLTEHRIKHLNKNHKIESIVVRTSQHANKFYEKMGFNLVKIEKDYWAKGFDLYLMELKNKEG